MKKLYVSENYIIYENGEGGVLEYPKAFTVYTKNLNGYELVEQSGIGVDRLTISVSDIPNIYDEAGTTAYTESTLVNFLRKNTGFKTASGGSEVVLWGSITGDIENQTDLVEYVDGKVNGNGNANAEFYHYSFNTGQDNIDFFNDGNIKISWDAPGNDVELYMLTQPQGTGDLVSYAKTGSSSVVSTAITQTNFKYDVFPTGVPALEVLIISISAEQDPNYPSYILAFHNAGSSYNTVVEIKKVTNKIP